MTCANSVVKEVIAHYQKARILTIQPNKIEQKIIELSDVFSLLIYMKLSPERRDKNAKVKSFQENLNQTMQFWLRNVKAKMTMSKTSKSLEEQQSVDEDMKFLESMMSDRVAIYDSRYEISQQREKERDAKKEGSKMGREREKAKKNSANSLDQYETDTNDEENEPDRYLPRARSHKRNV
jgi:hypothetical protein